MSRKITPEGAANRERRKELKSLQRQQKALGVEASRRLRVIERDLAKLESATREADGRLSRRIAILQQRIGV